MGRISNKREKKIEVVFFEKVDILCVENYNVANLCNKNKRIPMYS